MSTRLISLDQLSAIALNVDQDHELYEVLTDDKGNKYSVKVTVTIEEIQ